MKSFLDNREQLSSGRSQQEKNTQPGFQKMDKPTAERPARRRRQQAEQEEAEEVAMPAGSEGGPKVELVRDGSGNVAKILVTCPGGEKLEIECQF